MGETPIFLLFPFLLEEVRRDQVERKHGQVQGQEQELGWQRKKGKEQKVQEERDRDQGEDEHHHQEDQEEDVHHQEEDREEVRLILLLEELLMRESFRALGIEEVRRMKGMERKVREVKDVKQGQKDQEEMVWDHQNLVEVLPLALQSLEEALLLVLLQLEKILGQNWMHWKDHLRT